ncbi:MAG: hypothetical protein RLZZ241_446 [Bacteroidota bacterium]|jgi:GLPGLI family protein
MIRLIIVLGLAAFGQPFMPGVPILNAQEQRGSITINYDLQLNQLPTLFCAAELVYSNDVSVFYWHDNEQESTMESEPGLLRLNLRDSDPTGTINTFNFIEGILTTRSSLFGEPYLLKESVPELHWKLTSETKQLSGLQVFEAKTTFRGRNFTAWYAPELPIPVGPWKLQGLPGVILEAYDDEGFFKAVFTAIIQSDAQANPPELGFLPAKEIEIAQFQLLQEQMASELVRRIRAKLPRGTEISVQQSVSEFLERNFENP